jgi:hypothetical protein
MDFVLIDEEGFCFEGRLELEIPQTRGKSFRQSLRRARKLFGQSANS